MTERTDHAPWPIHDIRTRSGFAEFVRASFKASGLSQGEVARRMLGRGYANYNQMTVSRTLSGDRVVAAHEWPALADVLGIELVSGPDGGVLIELAALRAFKQEIESALHKMEGTSA